ncbi:hypothetical protein KKF84_00205 [Myxococcota bacterium]|nr:hypothetical protein [Myxococcota bacterium]
MPHVIDLRTGVQRTCLGLLVAALVLLTPAAALAQNTAFLTPPGEITSLEPRVHPVRSVSLSLLPFVSMNHNNTYGLFLNHFVINVTAEVAGPLRGMEISGMGSLREGNVSGFQLAGLFNANWKGNVSAMQVAGLLNFTTGAVDGFQLAGLFNANWEGAVRGMQVAGWMNVAADDMRGMQVAGVANVTGGLHRGMQLAGLINYAYGVRGMQVGLINVSRAEVRGVQLGLVNMAPSSSFSFGLINVIPGARNGLGLSVNSTGSTDLEFRNGGKHWHTFMSLGREHRDDFSGRDRTLIGLGFGLHSTTDLKTMWSVDAFHRQKYFDESTFMASTLRFSVDIPLVKPLHLSLGLGLTVFVYDGSLERPDSWYDGWLLRDGENRGSRHEVVLIPEVSAGLSCIF